MIMKLCMEQYVLKLYKVYINDDPELTLAHFKTMSNLAKLFCTYSRPRYQVSIKRTIGPLVRIWLCTVCYERLKMFKNVKFILDSTVLF